MAGSVILRLFYVVLCLAMAVSLARATLTCSDTSKALGPCIPYSKGKGASPPAACCSGVRSLKTAARTKADRQAVCNCLKTIAKGMSGGGGGVNYDRVARIPGKCGVSISFKVSPKTDCSRIG